MRHAAFPFISKFSGPSQRCNSCLPKSAATTQTGNSAMNKADLLRVIRKAKSSHIRWRAYAQALVAGLEVPADGAPVNHQSCGFGKWYYGEGARQLGHFRCLSRYRDAPRNSARNLRPHPRPDRRRQDGRGETAARTVDRRLAHLAGVNPVARSGSDGNARSSSAAGSGARGQSQALGSHLNFGCDAYCIPGKRHRVATIATR